MFTIPFRGSRKRLQNYDTKRKAKENSLAMGTMDSEMEILDLDIAHVSKSSLILGGIVEKKWNKASKSEECTALEELYLSHNVVAKKENGNLKVLMYLEISFAAVEVSEKLTWYAYMINELAGQIVIIFAFLESSFCFSKFYCNLEDLWFNNLPLHRLPAETCMLADENDTNSAFSYNRSPSFYTKKRI